MFYKTVCLIFISFFAMYCKNNEVIFTKDDRTFIDTTTASQTIKMSKDLDKWCVDSTPIIRQKFIDSLLIVRQTEINKRLSGSNN